MVLWTAALGLLLSGLLLLLTSTVWSDRGPDVPDPWIMVLWVVITTVGLLAYVRVRHGDTWEEHNFYEVSLSAGILLLAPPSILGASLAGVLIAEVILRRRAWLKVAYNLGQYAAATSAMILTYIGLAGEAEPISDLLDPGPGGGIWSLHRGEPDAGRPPDPRDDRR